MDPVTARKRRHDNVPPIRAKTDDCRPDNDRNDGGDPSHDMRVLHKPIAYGPLVFVEEHPAKVGEARRRIVELRSDQANVSPIALYRGGKFQGRASGSRLP